MTQENWNRWGPEDERGALNLIDADAVKRASVLVTAGQVISLAQALSPRTPFPPHRSGLQHFMGRSGGDYAAGARRPGGFQFAEDTLMLPAHIGTHIDALCHVWYDDQLYNGPAYAEPLVRPVAVLRRWGRSRGVACCWMSRGRVVAPWRMEILSPSRICETQALSRKRVISF